MFENLENVLCDELEMVNEQYKDGHEINSGDLAKVDLIAHALKSLAGYKELSGMDDGTSERSYASYRGRSRASGRMSRARSGRDPRGTDPYGDYR